MHCETCIYKDSHHNCYIWCFLLFDCLGTIFFLIFFVPKTIVCFMEDFGNILSLLSTFLIFLSRKKDIEVKSIASSTEHYIHMACSQYEAFTESTNQVQVFVSVCYDKSISVCVCVCIWVSMWECLSRWHSPLAPTLASLHLWECGGSRARRPRRKQILRY